MKGKLTVTITEDKRRTRTDTTLKYECGDYWVHTDIYFFQSILFCAINSIMLHCPSFYQIGVTTLIKRVNLRQHRTTEISANFYSSVWWYLWFSVFRAKLPDVRD